MLGVNCFILVYKSQTLQPKQYLLFCLFKNCLPNQSCTRGLSDQTVGPSVSLPLKMDQRRVTVVDPGGTSGEHPPQWDPILVFSHLFLLKSAHIRGQCPPQWVSTPQREILDPQLGCTCYG